jgi:hypothetical protein
LEGNLFVTWDWAATPASVPYADLNNPQSLNQYAYVRNNPMSYGDADGHDCPTCPIETIPEATPENVQKTLDGVQKATQATEGEAAAAGEAGGLGLLGTLIPGVLGGVLLEQGLEYYAGTENIKSQTQLDEVIASNRIRLVTQMVVQQRADIEAARKNTKTKKQKPRG